MIPTKKKGVELQLLSISYCVGMYVISLHADVICLPKSWHETAWLILDSEVDIVVQSL